MNNRESNQHGLTYNCIVLYCYLFISSKSQQANSGRLVVYWLTKIFG